MDEPDLMEDIHRELEARRVRINKIALLLAFLALFGLWCFCQAVIS